MKKRISLFLLLIVLSIIIVKAEEQTEEAKVTVNYDGATVLQASVGKEKDNYSSNKANQNALLVKGGTSKLVSPTIKKTGDGKDETADLYGTNAAVLAINQSVLTIDKGSIATNGKYANGVFSYGTGTINVTNTNIVTKNNNSAGIMVAGGGKINTSNTNVTTSGISAPAIRSERGGGDIAVEKGTFKTTGVASPAIYSTAYITIESSTLEASTSEGIVVEGPNSVELSNTTLVDTNTKLFDNSETYKNILLYQSAAKVSGTTSFKSTYSTITTNKGDTFFVTNTQADISLNNTKITNNDPTGVLLRIGTSKWGNKGKNGADVKLTLEAEDIKGDIEVDKESTLDMFISTNSLYQGSINKDKKGKVKLAISSESNMILEGDSYVDSLENPNTDNTNIYANGHKLYVNGKKVKINERKYGEKVPVKKETNNNILFYIVGVIIMVVLLAIIILILVSRRKKEEQPQVVEVQIPMMDATPKSVNEVYKNIRR